MENGELKIGTATLVAAKTRYKVEGRRLKGEG